MDQKSFNPHWIGEECCRDYRIGNIVLTSVPDKFVLRNVENQFYDTVLRKHHVDDFTENTTITIPYNQSVQATAKGRRA